MKMHPNVTMERIVEAIKQDNNIGFCVACGEERSQVEPDARKLPCDCCGEKEVYGAEELLLSLT